MHQVHLKKCISSMQKLHYSEQSTVVRVYYHETWQSKFKLQPITRRLDIAPTMDSGMCGRTDAATAARHGATKISSCR
jgi:hypothetical protein